MGKQMSKGCPESTNPFKSLKIMDIVTAVLFILVFCLITLEFFNISYDWDIDHEIYFGQRLLHGELLWTNEFHDKLPLVPFLFLIPALFSSVTPWRVISLVAILLAAWSLTRLLPAVTGLDRLNDHSYRQILHIGALIYISWMVLLPGSISVVNSLATSMQLISILLIFYLSIGPELPNNKRLLLTLVAGFTGTIAISIRPYIIAETAVIIIATIIWQQIRSKKPKIIAAVSTGAGWGLAFGFWGVIFNILPYALTGQMQVFFEGMSMLASNINPMNAFYSFLANLRTSTVQAFWGTFIFLFFSLILKSRSLPPQSTGLFLIIVTGAIAELLMMISKIYWPHYIILFVGTFSILLVLHLSTYLEGTKSQFCFQKFMAILPVMAVMILLILALNIKCWRIYNGTTEDKESTYKAISYYLTNLKKDRPNFLVIFDMKTHWRLNESRHGFPHAANTHHIYTGWWQEIKPASTFFTPRDAKEYCSRIKSNGPKIIFDMNDGDMIECLSNKGSGYQLEKTLPGTKIVVFHRIQ